MTSGFSSLKILVTGASGFIGSHLSERLAPENEMILVDDFSVGPRSNLASLEERPKVAIVAADVTDQDRMQELGVLPEVLFSTVIFLNSVLYSLWAVVPAPLGKRSWIPMAKGTASTIPGLM